MTGKHTHRVWWEPTDDPDKTEFAGAWWPGAVCAAIGSNVWILGSGLGCTEVAYEFHVQALVATQFSPRGEFKLWSTLPAHLFQEARVYSAAGGNETVMLKRTVANV